jgi:LysM repeat protein
MYSGTFLAIIAVVAISYQPPEHFDAAASSIEVRQSATQLSDVSIDDIIATSVAANVAQTANLPITNNIANLTQSLVAERVLAQNDANVVEKPQVLNINENRREIKNHKVAKGDTIKSIAEQYQVSAQTVKWANNITGDSVSVGQKLKILPVDGVLYTAQSGDSIDSIAKKYNANKDQLALFNDLEIDGRKSKRSN